MLATELGFDGFRVSDSGAVRDACGGYGEACVAQAVNAGLDMAMTIDAELPWCKAIVAAWLPGSEGGGIADVLFGDYNFTGTLTHTWPASADQIPVNAGPVYNDEQHGSGGSPLFPCGFGLKYDL